MNKKQSTIDKVLEAVLSCCNVDQITPITAGDVRGKDIAHDLARVGMSKDNIIEAARQFWFCDDDFDDNEGKVWWYYTSKK